MFSIMAVGFFLVFFRFNTVILILLLILCFIRHGTVLSSSMVPTPVHLGSRSGGSKYRLRW